MNIVVCVKQVPYATNVRIDPKTNTLVREGVESVIVRIRERLGEGKVTILSMGPPQAENALREAISLGADEAVLVCSRAFAGGDTWATSLTLSKAVAKLNPDLVLAGKQAIDGDTAQVGPGIATHLDWPQACYVSKIRDIAKGKATVECLMETGKEVLEISLPAVFTVVKEINEPRLPSLKGKMRAKKAVITMWNENDLGIEPERVGLKGSPTAVKRSFTPEARAGGEIIEAETASDAGKILVAKIREMQIA